MHTLVTDSIDEATEILKSGELVAFPTETVFGLGALINNRLAVEKIFLIKGRAKDNPLIVHISDLEMLNDLVVNIQASVQKLVDNFWPGPLTIILPKKDIVPDFVTSNLPSVAIRFPKHKIAQELIAKCKSPIVAPSANISGKPSSTQYQHVLEDFEGKIPCVLKGKTIYGLESTVIDCTKEPFTILRSGAVTVEELKQLVPIQKATPSKEKPKSPGMKYKHYAPKAKVMIFTPLTADQVKIESSAYIGSALPKDCDFAKKLICKNLEEYAENLFAFFRECDACGIKTIYCEKPKNLGLGIAINERLNKASGK